MMCNFSQIIKRLLAILFVVIISPVKGDAQTIDYSVHANILYHFTKYVNWPAENSNSDFVIGLLGNSPMEAELKKATANKFVGKRKIVIKVFTSLDVSIDCNILFISDDKSSLLKKVLLRTSNYPILIVTEDEGLASKGSCINFVIEDERTKLEFNTVNINKRNLKIANELLALGSIVK